MNRKTTVIVVFLILLLSSLFVVGQGEEQQEAEECGFFCKVWNVLWGSSEARAGKAWWDRGALVGEATAAPAQILGTLKDSAGKETTYSLQKTTAGGKVYYVSDKLGNNAGKFAYTKDGQLRGVINNKGNFVSATILPIPEEFNQLSIIPELLSPAPSPKEAAPAPAAPAPAQPTTTQTVKPFKKEEWGCKDTGCSCNRDICVFGGIEYTRNGEVKAANNKGALEYLNNNWDETVKAAKSVGIEDVNDQARVSDWQQKIIAEANLPDTHYCKIGEGCWTLGENKGTAFNCIGTVSKINQCVPDGITGQYTQTAIVSQAGAPAVITVTYENHNELDIKKKTGLDGTAYYVSEGLKSDDNLLYAFDKEGNGLGEVQNDGTIKSSKKANIKLSIVKKETEPTPPAKKEDAAQVQQAIPSPAPSLSLGPLYGGQEDSVLDIEGDLNCFTTNKGCREVPLIDEETGKPKKDKDGKDIYVKAAATHDDAYERMEALAQFKEQQAAKAAPVVALAAKRDQKETEIKNTEEALKDTTLTTTKKNELNAQLTQQKGELGKINGDLTTAEQTSGISEEDAKKADAEAKEARTKADNLEWQGSFVEEITGEYYQELVKGDWAGGQVVGGVLDLFSELGSYRALSNALVPEATEQWLEVANSEMLNQWSDLPAFAAREMCGIDEKKQRERPGQSAAFIHTPSGTYQFVGSIQAEKSPQKSPILCERNPNEEAEELFICSPDQVCKDNAFCYESEDAEVPVEGWFYKISWGVTAPQDEKFTPYVDEDGKAVRFNIQLQGAASKWVFKRVGAFGESVMALENGAADGGTLIKFLPEEYTRVCIKFHPDYRLIDDEGDPVTEICADFIPTAKGQLDYENSDRSQSITSTSEGVSLNI